MSEILRNCRLCKKAMEISPFILCQLCLIESDKVNNYLKKNPHTSIKEISLYTKITFDRIKEMVELGLIKSK